MKVSFMLNGDTVKSVCINNNFYTAGSNKEYRKMLSMTVKDGAKFTVEEVYEIAEDIAAHTPKEGATARVIAQLLLNSAYCVIFED